MGLLDTVLSIFRSRAERARAEIARIAAREVEGTSGTDDAAALEKALIEAGQSPEEYSAALSIFRRRRNLQLAQQDIPQLTKVALEAAKVRDAFFDETQSILREREKRQYELDAEAHQATHDRDRAERAKRELEAWEYTHAEIFAKSRPDLDAHTLVWGENRLVLSDSAPVLGVSRDVFERERDRRRDLYAKAEDCAHAEHANAIVAWDNGKRIYDPITEREYRASPAPRFRWPTMAEALSTR